MTEEEPSRRTIVTEVVVFALLFVLVGAAFVMFRVLREGDRVLNYDVRESK
jgi:hypothetical protein